MITTAPRPLRLYLIRHGETEWSLSGQHSGRADISLTAHGEDEARAVGQRLRNIPFAHVLTSPLQRAKQTCALAGLGLTHRIEPDLAEWDNGDDESRRAKFHRCRMENLIKRFNQTTLKRSLYCF